VLGIDQDDAVVGLQQVEDRLPVHAGTLHRHLLHLLRVQPVIERQQIGRHGGKRPHVALHRPVLRGEQHTRHHTLLMHIQATAPRILHLH
jgi:hypothetical protein